MPTLISSISGVRGIIDDGFDDAVVTDYTRAFSKLIGPGPIIIGQDSRPTGKRFKSVVCSVLSTSGNQPIDCGICPTPTVQLMVKELKAPGGIIVTASHNPIEWNALKFVGQDGLFLDSKQHARLQKYLKESHQIEKSIQVNQMKELSDCIDQHIKNVLSLELVRVEKIKERHFKIVVDAVNGAGSEALPTLLEALGCQVVRLNCDNNGNFVHPPEPLPQNMTELMQRVKDEKADLGLTVDPDADRLALIDENGIPLVEEYTLVLAAFQALRRSPIDDRRPLVTNLSTTMAIDELASYYKRTVLRTSVGEIHVARQMQKQPTLIGGEGNGGVILPESHLGRDSLVGIGLILSLLAETNKSLSGIAKDLPRYEMIKDRLEIPGKDPRNVLNNLAKEHKALNPNLQDGVKISWPDRWVHFRASNTEPIIRVYAEGKNKEIAEKLAAEFKIKIEKLLTTT